MKIRTFLSIILLFAFFTSTQAQTPQSFKYQAVVRNNTGDIQQYQAVSFKISILEGSATGTVVYSETHFGATNQFGLINLDIGKGTSLSGDFTTISWGTNDYFLKIELDASGGSTYQLMGTTQLLSVPYAIFAGNGVQFDENLECDESTEGMIRYNYETKALELCDGTSWTVLGSGSPGFECGNMLVDSRDGQSYPTVQIGSQCWMAKNLNYGTYTESINTNAEHADVTNNGIPEKYALDNDTTNFALYGGLYDWNELMNYTPLLEGQGICPEGWHVPSHDEYLELIEEVGGFTLAGEALMVGGSSGFNFPLGGYRRPKGHFNSGGLGGGLWTSLVSASDDTRAWNIYFNQSSAHAAQATAQMITGKSCRCIKD